MGWGGGNAFPSHLQTEQKPDLHLSTLCMHPRYSPNSPASRILHTVSRTAKPWLHLAELCSSCVIFQPRTSLGSFSFNWKKKKSKSEGTRDSLFHILRTVYRLQIFNAKGESSWGRSKCALSVYSPESSGYGGKPITVFALDKDWGRGRGQF